jgi:hypothetical protein
VAKQLRRSSEAALPGLIRNLLGIHAVHTEELPDDIQHTKERKPDVLKKVTDKIGETFVLHVEFQVKDESEMVFRMAEYYIMLLRRHQLPVQQYFSKLRHIRQLRILAQLRNLASESLSIMDSIANYITEEKDILYRRGELKGMEKGRQEEKEMLVKNLLLNTDFTVSKIAGLTNVAESFVKKVRNALK